MKKINIGALIGGIISTITVLGFLLAVGLLIYFAIKKQKNIVSGLALGIGIGIIILGTTCFVISVVNT